MAAAVLTIDINARLAKLEEGLAQANRRLGSFQGQVKSAGDSLKNALGGLAIGATAAKFTALIKGAIDGADKLNDLSKTTGIAVTTLGGIGFAAEQAGSSLDGIVGPIGKLNLEIAKAAQGNPEAAATFDTLKINVLGANKEVKNAGQVLVELAAKFETYKDGPNKAALANALFKKGYAELIPLLNEGSDSLRQNIAYYEKYSGMTTEVAQKSDKFNDELAKAKLLTAGFFRNIAADLLPALTGYVQAMTAASESHGGFREQSAKTAESIKLLAEWAYRGATAFQFFGEALGARAAQAAAFLSGEFTRAGKIGDLLNEDFAKFQKDRDEFLKRVNNPSADTGPSKPTNRIQAPGLPNNDATKKALEGQIKAFEDSIRDEKRLLADRERFLQTYYTDDELSIREFFDARQTIIDLALAKELDAYDGEIAALRKFASTARGQDRIKAEQDLAEVVRKRADAQQEAATKSQGNWFEERRALKGFRDDLEQTSIRLRELAGDKVGAALASFDFSNRQRKVRIDLEINSPDAEVRRIAALARDAFEAERAQVSVQAQLNDATQRFGDTLDRVGLAQSRIDIARRSGSLTELEALRASGDANRERIAQLQRIADEYQAIADSASDPRAQLAADQLRLKIEELAAAGDLVAKKFNDVFVDSFSDAISSFATGAKSAKDILKDLEKSLVAGISRIASQNIAETIFKPENFGGLGKVFGDLFGGKSKAPAGAPDVTGGAALQAAGSTLTGAGSALTGAGSALTGAGSALTGGATTLTSGSTTLTTAASTLLTAGASLDAAAASLSAASASLSASGIGGGLGGITGGFGSPGISSDVFSFFGFAEGTDSAPGGLALVGERGPELVHLPRGARVTPNHKLSSVGGKSVTIHAPITIAVQGMPNTRTANQIGLEAYRGITRAARRNG